MAESSDAEYSIVNRSEMGRRCELWVSRDGLEARTDGFWLHANAMQPES